MENSEKKRILVIEDDEHIAEGIRLNLDLQGYMVKIAGDGMKGIDLWKKWAPDLVVLDIMLPLVDGFSVLKVIRKQDEKLPVLILSARGSSEDKVKGLRCGVDDYLAKPFDLDEFLLRVKRLLIKKQWYKQDINNGETDRGKELFSGDNYCFGENEIDFITCRAKCSAGLIILTEQEIKLIKIFIANRGKPISREKLLETGWGYSKGTTTRTIDNFMVRLRKYFEINPKKPRYFKSMRSIGYIFDH